MDKKLGGKDMEFSAVIDQLIDSMAKPPNSLGLLEKHIKKVMLGWGKVFPEIKPYHLIFAADNGIVAEGVVRQPERITYLQAQNMDAGRATISCFCQANQIAYSVIDVGINSIESVGINRKVARGTKNFLTSEAMSVDEFDRAYAAGGEMVRKVAQEGYNLISFGEMGIGNTTTSSAVLHSLTGMRPEFVVGYGANPNNPEVIKRKRIVIAEGAERHKLRMNTEEDILRCVGGFDIVAIYAGMLECAKVNIPFVLDGFITAVAYACAARHDNKVEAYAIPSHMSREPGMAYALLLGNILVDEVPIRADLALGEGSGAVLMINMLKTMMYAVTNAKKWSELDSVATKNQLALEAAASL